MLVGDFPVPAGLAEAGGVANLHVQRPAGGQRAMEALKGMAERDVLAGRDPQVPHLALDRAVE